MSFWIREMAGWALVLAGMVIFVEVFGFCLERQVVQAGIMTVVGFIVFRGGIHLLKVAVAARVCHQVHNRLYPVAPAAAESNRGKRAITSRSPANRGS